MPNRLALETSPYLLQHAGNPVDWHPWDRRALDLARERDVPILLSVGYSACHWCHVMERESFEDRATAEAMNRSFVNVKVDREERPDVDSVYMSAVQAMAGQGGWPLTAFLTPDGKPFYGGTYFPPEPRHGMPSFRQVLTAVAQAWVHRRADAVRSGDRIVEVLAANAGRARGAPAAPSRSLVDGAVNAAARSFDPVHGGFGSAPKFPQPVFLDFLLRTGGPGSGPGAAGPDAARPGVPEARATSGAGGEQGPAMAIRTLERMAAGGIRDHVGGGFHRYSVDARWLVPHFEKMLYDNVLIARALTRAHLLGAAGLGAVAEEALDYVLDDLRSPEGAFYSARDADSESPEGRHEEGAFYVWTLGEAREALSGSPGAAGASEPTDAAPPGGSARGSAGALDAAAADLFCRVHDVTASGNFEGRNILHLPHDPAAVAAREGIDRREMERILSSGRAALARRRASRPHPLRDDKVLTSWNGFAIRALAEAGAALGRPDYVEAALRAAGFLLDAVGSGDRLFHVFAGGRAHVDGFLEDYGAMGTACLALHRATGDARWQSRAESLMETVLARFWTPDQAMFHDAADDAEPLVVRPRDVMDNATPSGSGLALELAASLARRTGSAELRRVADRVLAREHGAMAAYPLAMGHHLAVAIRHRTERRRGRR